MRSTICCKSSSVKIAAALTAAMLSASLLTACGKTAEETSAMVRLLAEQEQRQLWLCPWIPALHRTGGQSEHACFNKGRSHGNGRSLQCGVRQCEKCGKGRERIYQQRRCKQLYAHSAQQRRHKSCKRHIFNGGGSRRILRRQIFWHAWITRSKYKISQKTFSAGYFFGILSQNYWQSAYHVI